MKNIHPQILKWFADKNWQIFPFQNKTWQAYYHAYNGLIHTITGSGKTYAIWFAILNKILQQKKASTTGLQVLWLTPLRALAINTLKTLTQTLVDFDLPWHVELRTSDTSPAKKQRQKKYLPEVLITTPESLSLLISQKQSELFFKSLHTVVVDEWHELLASKRGVQTELCLARLRHWQPKLLVWGLSATLANLPLALNILTGTSQARSRIITSEEKKSLDLKILIPKKIERFPWAGHLGTRVLPQLIQYLEKSPSTLLFANTRAQVELWFQALLEAKPEWAGIIAVHHGSLAKKIRLWVEDNLRLGRLKVVVCTSSLDLGVDFSPVELVVQIGSPKGIARLLQRAGRSWHQPGNRSKILCVPTHALEILEFVAVEKAINDGFIEPTPDLQKPYDVLIQHVVTLAIGPGFKAEELYQEILTSYRYKNLTQQEWQWILEFVCQGSACLHAYPEYHKIEIINGFYKVVNPTIARRHRMSIGTITASASITVKFQRGQKIAEVEEQFISRLKPGERFILAGKTLEFLRLKDMTALVKKASGTAKVIPRWLGGKMPLSTQLATVLQQLLDELATRKLIVEPLQPILSKQSELSCIPQKHQCLLEITFTREGQHLFCYPFAGRAVNEALAMLCAYRLSRQNAYTFHSAVNDYGFELASPKKFRLTEDVSSFFNLHNWREDLLASINIAEMAERQFRDIARIAGLVFSGYPGSQKTTRQIQTSTSLLYKIFKKYDPENLLLKQATEEVLAQQMEQSRLLHTLEKLQKQKFILKHTLTLTPFSFPIWVNLQRLRFSTETIHERIASMLHKLERK